MTEKINYCNPKTVVVEIKVKDVVLAASPLTTERVHITEYDWENE